MLVRTHPAAVCSPTRSVQQVKFRYFASMCCLHLQCSSLSVVSTVKGQAAARSQIHTQAPLAAPFDSLGCEWCHRWWLEVPRSKCRLMKERCSWKMVTISLMACLAIHFAVVTVAVFL
ncbi:unnamed protein product [Urochloa humidicola]